MTTIHTLPLIEGDREWAARLVEGRWGSRMIVTRGRVHDAGELPAFVAMRDGKPAGLTTYRIDGDECELISLDSLVEGVGVGSALMAAVREVAMAAGCRRLWLIATNDIVAALRFYQRRGFVLVGVHRNALEESRRLKPEIPLIGIGGIPLRDEIELEIIIGAPAPRAPEFP